MTSQNDGEGLSFPHFVNGVKDYTVIMKHMPYYLIDYLGWLYFIFIGNNK